MISTLKVTDGDLIVVNLEGTGVSQSYIEHIRQKITTWAKRKGLNNVEVMVSGGDVKIAISTLSVNDVFEDEVLKGENNG